MIRTPHESAVGCLIDGFEPPGRTRIRHLIELSREAGPKFDLKMAEALLADVRRLDPSSAELTASANALAAARNREAEDARRAAEQRAAAEREAQRKAAAEKAAAEQKAAEARAAAEQKAAAEKAAAEQKAAAEKAAAEQKAAADKAAAERIEAAKLAAAKLAADQVPTATVAAQPSAEPANVPATTAAVTAPAREEPVAEQARAEQPVIAVPQEETAAEVETQPAPMVSRSQSPVAASSLSRTRYVAPKYPRSAQRRGLSGWVDVVFTVDIDGTVSDVSIRGSNPDDTFVSAASNAVERWEFEPVIENGVAVQKRAAVRMMFALE